jgi:excisionase family DNA binding protein
MASRTTGSPSGCSSRVGERLLSIADVADLLGVSRWTLYGWRCRREGPPGLKIGGRVRYRPDDLEQWIEEHREEPVARGR